MRVPRVLDWDNRELWREMFIHDGVCKIPEGVEVIGNAKEDIEDEELGTKPNGVFSECGITELYLPNTLRYLGYGAFCDNYIDELYIPEGVVEIGDWALEYTRARYIEISDTVRVIKDYGIDFTCADTVIFGRGIEAIYQFWDFKEGADLYVYNSTKSKKQVESWVEVCGTPVNVIVLD